MKVCWMETTADNGLNNALKEFTCQFCVLIILFRGMLDSKVRIGLKLQTILKFQIALSQVMHVSSCIIALPLKRS